MIEITLPASKSIYNRVLILNALQHTEMTLIAGVLSDDSRILESQLEQVKNGNTVVNIGEAGTSMRFMTALLAASDGIFELTGAERILERPIAPLVNALNTLGAEIKYLQKDDYLPILIKGKKISGGNVQIDGSVSSQFISALMLIAPLLEKGIEINIENTAVSFPYIEMTAKILKQVGIESSFSSHKIAIPAQQLQLPMVYFVESDWSSAAFWYEVLMLHPSITQLKLKNLAFSGIQGDEIVASIYRQLGVETMIDKNDLIIKKHAIALPTFFEIDLSDAPDLAPALVVTLALLKIKSEIRGLITLNKKESERILVLKKELEKLGVMLNVTDEMIQLNGFSETEPQHVFIDVHNDHRMEMAFAPLLFLGNGNGIEDAHTVSKSYPNFWDEFNKILNHTQWED